MEAYLFMLGAPFVAFVGYTAALTRFEGFDKNVALNSPFMVQWCLGFHELGLKLGRHWDIDWL